MALARLEPALPEDVLGYIANCLLGQKSPLYDDGDLARDALSLLMVAKATPLKNIGLKLCSLLCPYLGKASVDGVTAVSKAPAIKAKLKALGQPHTGNKPELVQRLNDLMEGATPHSPVSNALRARTLHLKQVCISDGAAKKTFNFRPSKTPGLRESGVQEVAGNFYGAGFTVTYRLQDVKVHARKRFSCYKTLLNDKNWGSEWAANYEALQKERKAALQAELQRRGVAAEAANNAFSRWWHHPFLFGGEHQHRPTVEAAATDFVHDIFLHGLPTYHAHHVTQRARHVHRSDLAKYKQDREVVERAQQLALTSWVHSFASVGDALSCPGLPPGLRARVLCASTAPAPRALGARRVWRAEARRWGPCPTCGKLHQIEGECTDGHATTSDDDDDFY